jgi:hypothetical protein
MKVMIIKEACTGWFQEKYKEKALIKQTMNFKLGNFQKRIKEKSHG